MSWSLQLRNGDLALGGTQLGRVTGNQKLTQDLRCVTLTPRGHDLSHPSYGSLIDGGREDSGDEIPSLIGSVDWERAALRVRGEIQRVCAEHQQRQLARARQDRFTYGESTLSNDELLMRVNDIDIIQVQDTLFVRVLLETGTGTPINLDVPVASEPTFLT